MELVTNFDCKIVEPHQPPQYLLNKTERFKANQPVGLIVFLENSGSSLNQLFTDKGLAQTAKCIRKIKKGEWALPVDIKDKQFIPLLIVSEGMPGDAYNRRLYEIVADKAKSIIHDKDVLPFIILTAEEVEILEAIVAEKGAEEAIQILAEYTHLYLEKN